jgi:hypothetical protein
MSLQFLLWLTSWSERSADMFQTLQPKAQHDKGNLPLVEGCERFAQEGSCLCPAGDAGDVVDPAGKRFLGTVEIVLLEFIEGRDSADDRTMRVMNRNSANPNYDFVSGLVLQKS